VGATEIGRHNAATLAEPLRYVSGLSQVGDQVSIRGSSGFSRGTGSRVLLLLDGFPMLAADLGDIKWDAIPVSEIERVEVTKGAGSALYGTGALGGVINVLTRAPSIEPRTQFQLLSGLYSRPAYATWKWTDEPMYWSSADISHSRTVGQTGLVVAGGQQYSGGHYENGDYRRSHLYAKIHHSWPIGRSTTTASFCNGRTVRNPCASPRVIVSLLLYRRNLISTANISIY
jgi:outer membrane cobalamin receptor